MKLTPEGLGFGSNPSGMPRVEDGRKPKGTITVQGRCSKYPDNNWNSYPDAELRYARVVASPIAWVTASTAALVEDLEAIDPTP